MEGGVYGPLEGRRGFGSSDPHAPCFIQALLKPVQDRGLTPRGKASPRGSAAFARPGSHALGDEAPMEWAMMTGWRGGARISFSTPPRSPEARFREAWDPAGSQGMLW